MYVFLVVVRRLLLQLCSSVFICIVISLCRSVCLYLSRPVVVSLFLDD